MARDYYTAAVLGSRFEASGLDWPKHWAKLWNATLSPLGDSVEFTLE